MLYVNICSSHGKPNDDYKFDQDLAGKTYIVVGATSGIGKETTKELAKRKAKVIMACRLVNILLGPEI